jgi:hypothetical protein
MDFKNISNQELIVRLEKLARTERKLTHLILLHINEVEARQLYFKQGFESLFAYLTRGLMYSESAAYRRIQAARLLRTAPQVADKIESGALNLSQLSQVQKCIKEEKSKGLSIAPQKIAETLAALENKNTFESEQILAKEFELQIKTHDSIKPQRDESIRIEMTLSKEQFEDLRKAKDFLSHQCPNGNWSEVVTALAQKFIQSKLGKEKAPNKGTGEEIAQGNTATEVTAKLTTTARPARSRRYRPRLPTKMRRQVFAKAQHQCEFVNFETGTRCTSKFQLEIDHRKPLALDGGNAPENLRILCRAHNQRAWQMCNGI